MTEFAVLQNVYSVVKLHFTVSRSRKLFSIFNAIKEISKGSKRNTVFSWCHSKFTFSVTSIVSDQFSKQVHVLSYFLGYKTGFSRPKQSENLDPSENTDLDFWINLENSIL